MLELYCRVRLVTDRYSQEGAPMGSIGYVIERHSDDAYEVEVSDEQGTTIAQFVAQSSDLEPAE